MFAKVIGSLVEVPDETREPEKCKNIEGTNKYPKLAEGPFS